MGDVREREDPFYGASAQKSPLPDLKQLGRELLPLKRDDAWYPLK
jgi:hypothetical protein